MKTKEITQEQISALADGDLADEYIDAALAALGNKEGLADWELYHQIGDVLRSDDMAVTMSAGFSARMAARLEDEPILIAPFSVPKSEPVPLERFEAPQLMESKWPAKPGIRRFAIPGVVAAAAASIAFFTAPQLMVALQEKSTGSVNEVAVAVNPTSSSAVQPAIVSANGAEGMVLRDARIDDYLLAHQRFSPSVYSSAQYARSASIATDSNK